MKIIISLEELTNQTVESIAYDLGCDIAEEGNSMIYTDESSSKNISDESRLLDYSVEQSRSINIPVNEEEFKKEWGLLTGAAANF